MTENITEDPEILENDEEGTGGEEHYDGLAVETIPFDPTLFTVEEGLSEVDDD